MPELNWVFCDGILEGKAAFPLDESQDRTSSTNFVSKIYPQQV